MADQLLRRTVVNFLLTTAFVENSVETESDVFDLLPRGPAEQVLLKRSDGVGFGRIEDENSLVEDVEDLSDCTRVRRVAWWLGGSVYARSGRGRVGEEEGGRVRGLGRKEEELFFRKGPYSDCFARLD